MTAGDIPKTFRAALAAVDRNFRHLHPFNSSIMDGIEAATVWIDLLTATAYIAHTGACRVVIGGWDMEDTVKVGCCISNVVSRIFAELPLSLPLQIFYFNGICFYVFIVTASGRAL